MFHVRRSWPLAATVLLLAVGCAPGGHGSSGVPTGASVVPTPSPTPQPPYVAPPAAPVTVTGALYAADTGEPLSGATVLLDGSTQVTTAADGTFSATRSATVSGLHGSLTALKAGYGNVTVWGYTGGNLVMGPIAAANPPTTMAATLSFPVSSGTASNLVVSVSVKQPNTSAFQVVNMGTIPVVGATGQATATATVKLPAGTYAVAAYGANGATVVGFGQGTVAASTLSVPVSAYAGSFGTYSATVPLLVPNSTTYVSVASTFLTWPGDTPVKANAIQLTQLLGADGGVSAQLPPPSAFGVASASYWTQGEAYLNDGFLDVKRGVVKRTNVTPGNLTLNFLTQPTWSKYQSGREALGIPLQVKPDSAVTGANGYLANFLPYGSSGNPVWTVFSLGTSTDSVTVPILPASLRSSFDLAVGGQYYMQLGALTNPLNWGGDGSESDQAPPSGYYNQ